MKEQTALTEHDRKIKAAEERVAKSDGYAKKDAIKHLKRLQKEREIYIKNKRGMICAEGKKTKTTDIS